MHTPEALTPEQQNNLQNREAFDIELLEAGAEVGTDDRRKQLLLHPTDDQIQEMHQEMEDDLASRPLPAEQPSPEPQTSEIEEVKVEDEKPKEKQPLTHIPPEGLEPLSLEMEAAIKASEARISVERERFLLSEYQKSHRPEVAEAILKDYEWLIGMEMKRVLSYLERAYSEELVATIDHEDLFQEGRLGLLTAATRVDLSYPNRFATYANYWIKQFMTRWFINKHTGIRLPTNIHQEIRKAQAEAREGKLNSAARLNFLQELVHPSSQQDYRPGDDIDDPEEGLGDKWMIREEMTTDDQELMERLVEIDSIHNLLLETLEELTPIEREVIIERYGLFSESGKGKTLYEVGRHIGYSSERARQIEMLALRKFRKSAVSELIDYYP